jgi:lipoyl(octanoyl) transferase
MKWYCLDSGAGGFAWNMALDEALLEAAPRLGAPVLRVYGWIEPAASFGYFQRIAEVERLTLLRPLVRRPTGGGIVPHDADWTYSLVFPAGSVWYELLAPESYRRVHAWLRSAFQKAGIPSEVAPNAQRAAPGQCFEGYELSDLLWHGKKIAGAAQRRTRAGLLIQGSVQPPPLGLARENWLSSLRAAGGQGEEAEWHEFSPDPALLARAEELVRTKYSQDAYNRKR